jgi:hypothetical protein
MRGSKRYYITEPILEKGGRKKNYPCIHTWIWGKPCLKGRGKPISGSVEEHCAEAKVVRVNEVHSTTEKQTANGIVAQCTRED